MRKKTIHLQLRPLMKTIQGTEVSLQNIYIIFVVKESDLNDGKKTKN